jgi:hypothetical protein
MEIDDALAYTGAIDVDALGLAGESPQLVPGLPPRSVLQGRAGGTGGGNESSH